MGTRDITNFEVPLTVVLKALIIPRKQFYFNITLKLLGHHWVERVTMRGPNFSGPFWAAHVTFCGL